MGFATPPLLRFGPQVNTFQAGLDRFQGREEWCGISAASPEVIKTLERIGLHIQTDGRVIRTTKNYFRVQVVLAIG